MRNQDHTQATDRRSFLKAATAGPWPSPTPSLLIWYGNGPWKRTVVL
jgi:hypothetical protein